MKKLLLFAIIPVLFVFACTNSNDENSNEPQYEEFFSDFSDTDTIADEQTDYSDENDISDYSLSTDNLNKYLASPEQVVIFSFKTTSGKTLSLLTDEQQSYLVYRFGKPDNIELQFPSTVDNNSWKQFEFESYTTDNSSLKHIVFMNVDTRYTIYENTFKNSPQDNKTGVQIKLPSGKKIDIRADKSTVYGDLNYFKNNDKIKK